MESLGSVGGIGEEDLDRICDGFRENHHNMESGKIITIWKANRDINLLSVKIPANRRVIGNILDCLFDSRISIDNVDYGRCGGFEDRARSYKGVVINGNGGQQDRGREKREYQGKGKRKMYEETDSKWVRAAGREYKFYSNKNQRSGHRGEEENSRHRNSRREQIRSHHQDERARIPAGLRGESIARSEARSKGRTEGKEEGEIKEKELERSKHKETKVQDQAQPSQAFLAELMETQGELSKHQRKGKGKMFDEADSKWVRAADREHKSYNNKIHLSGHRGEEESSRHRNFRREQTRTHYQDERARVPAGPRGERAACSEAQTEGKEEGEIKEKEMERSNHKEEKVISNPSGGEQELDLEHMDLGLVEGNNLVSDVGTGLEEHHIGNASIRNKESLETESHVIFDEEIEEDVRMQEVASEDLEEKKHMEDMKGKDRVTGEMEKRQGTRKKVVKPSLGAAASNKLKMAQLVAAKRTVAKPGIRHGDHSKQGEEKGTSVPKHDPAKQAKDP
ncbi:hypothetical protein F2Q70_00025716 [Brassica cretica]|uniref:DUF4283 domain-containing protein n=1 Tax=Brassica cretica TaxID=69181 RepID=A0A8S9L6F5_BRACR|nr:hypothetical protein F2Q70_00025716 [Brassica cretica]